MHSRLPLLTDEEEAVLLRNLLSDPDDFLSSRLLSLHYHRLNDDTSIPDGGSHDAPIR